MCGSQENHVKKDSVLYVASEGTHDHLILSALGVGGGVQRQVHVFAIPGLG
jgi:hypothetical protein